MIDVNIGRLTVAAIHQAIAEELPTRVDFYEHWLRGEKVRAEGVPLAPMTAVLGFLRAEGAPYQTVMQTAGRLAAVWTVEGLSGARRSMLHRLPRWWRTRRVLALARHTIRESYSTTRVVSTVRKGHVHVEIQGSLFCRPRDPQPMPLCGFHAALMVGLLAAFDLPAVSHIDTCAGAAGAECTMTLELRNGAATADDLVVPAA